MANNNESFNYAHHIMEEPFMAPPTTPVWVYFNYFSEQQNTVDWQYLSQMVSIQANSATIKATLQTTMTLAGLSASMGINAPSMTAVMLFISLLSLEMSSSTTKTNFATTVSSVIKPITTEDATNLLTDKFSDVDYFFRSIKLSDKTDYQRNYLQPKYLFNSCAVFLGTMLLFDKMRLVMPITDVKNPRYTYQIKLAFNISNMVFHESMVYPITYQRSYANYMAPSMLAYNSPSCTKERGQYQNIKYYIKPVNDINKNIHNVLFRNSFPRLDTKYTTSINNYVALCYRYMFYSQFSNFDTNSKYFEMLRASSDATSAPFTEYLFDIDSTIFDGITLPNVLTKIGFDSITTMINQLERKDNGMEYNKPIIALYDNIISTASTLFTFYGKYINAVTNSTSCSIKGNSAISDSATLSAFDSKLKSIKSYIRPSLKARKDIGKLLDINSSVVFGDGQCYELLAPVSGGHNESGNLNAAFFKFYAGSMANVYLRQTAIEKLYYSKLDQFVNILKTTYDQDKGILEHVSPKQDWQTLSDLALTGSGSMDCIKDYLQIPNILSDILTEQHKGVFIKK